jgi:hypothetical protein
MKAFATQLLGNERLSQEESFKPVTQRLGIHVRQVGVGRQNQRTFGNLVIGF